MVDVYHFYLLAINVDLTPSYLLQNKRLMNSLIKECQIQKTKEILFGEYIHFNPINESEIENSDYLTERIWVIERILTKFPSFIFDLYESLDNGKILYKHTISKEDIEKEKCFFFNIMNNRLILISTLKSLTVDANLTIYFNPNYRQKFRLNNILFGMIGEDDIYPVDKDNLVTYI